MADVVTITDSWGSYYYINSSSRKDVLTQAQQDANAFYIRNYCAGKYPTWTVNAVAAICGNFAHEGVMNPSQWEYGYDMSLEKGFGLGQWTPATKLINWVEAKGFQRYQIRGQIDRVNYESVTPGAQWIPKPAYDFSMTEFLTSTQSPSYLASAWLYDWERPGDPEATEALRQDSAEYYYTLFTGSEPPDPPVPPDPPDPPEPTLIKRGLRPCYYHRFRYD